MLYGKKDGDGTYAFGLGKRAAYNFGLGKRAPGGQAAYTFGLGRKRDPYAFGLGKRADPAYAFGLGKRDPVYQNLGTLVWCGSREYQKYVRILSDNCQKTVRCKYLSYICQKTIRYLSEKCHTQICVRKLTCEHEKCLRNLSELNNVSESSQSDTGKSVRNMSEEFVLTII